MQASLTGVFLDGSGLLQPSVQPLNIPAVTAVTLSLAITGQNGLAHNLTGSAVVFTARKATKVGADPVLSIQGVIDNAVSGLCHVFIPQQATSGLRGAYDYDVTVVSAGGNPDQVVPVSPLFVHDSLYEPNQQVTVYPTASPLGQGPVGPGGPGTPGVYTDATRPVQPVQAGTIILNTDEGALQVSNGTQWLQDGARSLFDEMLADAPWAFWKCNETSTTQLFLDYSDGAGAGANTGHPNLRPSNGKRGSIIPRTIEGSQEQIQLTSNTSFPFGTTWTIEMWTQTIPGQTLGPVRLFASNDLTFVLNLNADGSLNVNSNANIAPPGTIVAGARYHLALTYNAGQVILYVNGALAGIETGDPQPASQAFIIKTVNPQLLQYLAFYTTQLFGGRIAHHYIAGNPYSLTPNVVLT